MPTPHTITTNIQFNITNSASMNQNSDSSNSSNGCRSSRRDKSLAPGMFSFFFFFDTTLMTGEKVSCEFDRITYCPRYNKHLKKLTAWAAFSAKSSSVEAAGGHDLCTELRKDLLRNSR
jgi:hypothetical protein